jgi:O-antigen/teichoic acid export membrane protein
MSTHMLRLGRQTLIYGLSAVAPSLLGLFTLPFVARRLSTTEYGLFELATTAIGVAATIVELGLTSASQRSFFDYTDEQTGERRTVLSTALITYMVSTLIAAIALIVARRQVAEFVFNEPRESKLIVIAAATIPAGALVNFTREVMRLHFRVWHFLTSSLIAGVVGTAATLIALLVLHSKVVGLLVSAVIAATLAAFYGLVVVRADLTTHFSRRELRVMLDYGLPLIPMALSLWALALIDRIMLSRLSNLGQVGQYAIANRLSVFLTFGATALGTAFSPFIFSLFAEDPEEEKLIRARALTYAAVVFALVTILMSLFAREAFEAIAPRFNSAYEAVGLVAFGLAVNGIGLIASTGIGLARRTRSLIWLTLIAAAVNIALNFLVIPPWGMLGAAFATAVAYTLLFGLYYMQSQRVYYTRFDLARLIRLGVLTAAAAAVGAIPIEPLTLALAIKIGVVLLFLVSLRVTGVVRPEEIGALRSVVRQRLRPTS